MVEECEGLDRYKNGFATHRAVTSIKSRHLRSVRAQGGQKSSRGMRPILPPFLPFVPAMAGELKTLELTRLQGGIRPTSMGHGVPWTATSTVDKKGASRIGPHPMDPSGTLSWRSRSRKFSSIFSSLSIINLSLQLIFYYELLLSSCIHIDAFIINRVIFRTVLHEIFFSRKAIARAFKHNVFIEQICRFNLSLIFFCLFRSLILFPWFNFHSRRGNSCF